MQNKGKRNLLSILREFTVTNSRWGRTFRLCTVRADIDQFFYVCYPVYLLLASALALSASPPQVKREGDVHCTTFKVENVVPGAVVVLSQI